jgi:hypothetical protein
MDADRIARFTGPYNLPGGMVPVVDGIPRWPWDEVVARCRLGQVAKLANLRLTGDEVFVESGSNDTWFLSGERYCRSATAVTLTASCERRNS